MSDSLLGDVVGLAIGVAVVNEVYKGFKKKKKKKGEREEGLFNFNY